MGCLFGGPSRVEAPQMDPEAISTACMEQCDKDGDGFISSKEAKEHAPGLAYAFRQLDVDPEDKKLSKEEVRQRFQDYVDSKMGVKGFNCFVVTRSGRALADGHVRLVPEDFMLGTVEAGEGDVVDDVTGMAEVAYPNDEGLFGMRAGMYRVEITSPTVKIGAKYNEQTTLGVEVSPFTNPFAEPGGGAKFKVGK